ncbi:MAG: dihydrolipoamide succinyltransferase, partial [Rhodospirillaceae bacterium]|nr:dihydrolipoamide succinyltransferase [Rhodospirillaceae bacterium]
MATEITVPTLGESLSEATVATWLKSVGDAVQADEPILELETDKVTIEVNAPAGGTLTQIAAEEGAEVVVGALLGVIGEGAVDAAPVPAAGGSGDAVNVVVPQLGESIAEATVATWFKAVGDAVAADEVLVELETDKVTLEVNAPSAGTLTAISADTGAEVEVGALLGTIGGSGAATAPT